MPSSFVDSIVRTGDDGAASAGTVAISCHENEVPAFVGPELDLLYGNLFSSMLQFDVAGLERDRTSTYVARAHGRPVALFLFQRDRGRVRVLNETIRIDEEELRRFADYIFFTYRSVGVIIFNAVEVKRPALGYPCQHANQLEDIAMSLPATPEEYLAVLGKNTRRNVKRYSERVMRSFPSYRFETYQREQIDEQLVRRIIGFNHARMATKNKSSNLDENAVRRVTRLARASGLIGVVTIDDAVCAGAISYRAGANYFLDILAHDPAYDDYWVGILCCYQTICECIRQGGKEFHFLWGRYDYKFTLGASIRELDLLAIYRSRPHMLLHAGVALKAAYDGRMRRLKLWLESGEPQQGALPRFAFRCLTRLRDIKATRFA